MLLLLAEHYPITVRDSIYKHDAFWLHTSDIILLLKGDVKCD